MPTSTDDILFRKPDSDSSNIGDVSSLWGESQRNDKQVINDYLLMQMQKRKRLKKLD